MSISIIPFESICRYSPAGYKKYHHITLQELLFSLVCHKENEENFCEALLCKGLISGNMGLLLPYDVTEHCFSVILPDRLVSHRPFSAENEIEKYTSTFLPPSLHYN